MLQKVGIIFFGLIISHGIVRAQLVQQWASQYHGVKSGIHSANAIAVDNAGNVYVTGQSAGDSTGADIATMSYNTAGTQQWAYRYDGPDHKDDVGVGIAVDNSGNVYMVGTSDDTATGTDIVTIKYGPSGVQWVRRYNSYGKNPDAAVAIALDRAGNVYVIGNFSGNTGIGCVTLKYNPSGVEQWVQRYDTGTSFSFYQPRSLAVDAAGDVHVFGTNGYSGEDFLTIKYSTDGVRQWIVRYKGINFNDEDRAASIAIDDSSNVYVFGQSREAQTQDYDFVTIKYNSSGIEQWVARWNPQGSPTLQAVSIMLDKFGGVYVAGQLYNLGTGLRDYFTMKYDKAGAKQWKKQYAGSTNTPNVLHALAVDTSGNVFVTGGSGTDVATVMYTTDGKQYSVAKYDGPRKMLDVGNAVVTDAFGNVYVTGNSFDSTNGHDGHYVTIKYSIPVVSVDDEKITQELFSLTQNYPNPFTQLSVVSCQLTGRGVFEVRDMLGRVVYRTSVSSGSTQLTIDASEMPNGLYLYSLTDGKNMKSRMMSVMK